MNLTIGTAVYDDFDGLFFTLEALREYHDLGRYQAEIVVVDNHPAGNRAQDIRHYVGSIKEMPARLVSLESPVGTSPARNVIFEHAQGEIVLVMDCHVLIRRGGLQALLDFFDDHPEPVLLSGPLVSYDRQHVWTHFDPIWRAGMWGIWGTDERGREPHFPAFQIPAMGLGLFACRKKHWPGFHPLARGFGGEECYIHEKIRRAGGAAWCLPALRWVHRFHNQTTPTPYPNNWRDRARNYVLEFLELGRDIEEVAQHFVNEQGILSAEEFAEIAARARDEWKAHLLQQTSTTTPAPTSRGCGCGQSKPMFASAEAWWEFEIKSRAVEPEILEALAEAVPAGSRVVHVNPGPSTAVAILKNRPSDYIAISPKNPDRWWRQAVAVAGGAKVTYLMAEEDKVRVPNPDIVVLEKASTADRVLRILSTQQANRRAVVLGTAGAGETALDGGPGILPAVRKFVRDNPGWLTTKVVDALPGLIVLSADPADRPALPNAWQMVKNFVRAVHEHVATGGNRVSRELLEQRLNICTVCEKRTLDDEGRDRCSVCGCYLIGGIAGVGGKAEWASQDCPLGKWPAPQEIKETIP